jgi:hypothetical protein
VADARKGAKPGAADENLPPFFFFRNLNIAGCNLTLSVTRN